MRKGICMSKKKEREPQWYMSEVGVPVYNYHVYHMKKVEKIIYILLAFVVGAVVAYLFYGGIGKDELGRATSVTYVLDVVIMVVVGSAAVKLCIPVRREQLIEKKKNVLKIQFRDLLDSVSTSLSSGQNVTGAFISAYDDLQLMYGEDESIIKELKVIIDGINNNFEIEKLLMNLGERSGVDDIQSFANVFETAYRKGGNIKDIIKNTQQIIADKMEIESEIETMVAANQMEQKIMMIMPIMIVGMLKMLGEDFAENFVTPTGLVATTIGVIAFVTAYFVGKKILDIKV